VRTGTEIARAHSNADFGARIGLHFTMASRLRNGKRAPSSMTLAAIQDAFELTPEETHAMLQAAITPETFGDWVRANLYDLD
jgi:transcriptional regulator with XRE-family HTH domain